MTHPAPRARRPHRAARWRRALTLVAALGAWLTAPPAPHAQDTGGAPDAADVGETDPVEPQEHDGDSALPYVPGTPPPGGVTGPTANKREPFHFGAYGRVQPSTDLAGGQGKRARIVFPSPRVDEGSYTELEFGYRALDEGRDGVQVDTITTIAFTDDIFHYDGEFDSTVAVRNLYAEARNLFLSGVFVWAGSRMYRGDDVYLLDFWPLDNLNTYGGGAGWASPHTRVGWHAGVNRLNNAYQFQTIEVVREGEVGAGEVVFLDRQRLITSLKAEHLFYSDPDAPGFKVKVYGELHHLPDGALRREQPRQDIALPDDSGWLAGVQLGAWNIIPGARRSFFNLFLRYTAGMAAYGEFSVPFGVDQDKRARDADAYQVAFSGNVDTELGGVMIGGYARYFTDADGFEEDFDDGWDMAFAIRPMAFIGDYFTPGFEVSYQGKRPNGVNPATGTQDLASIWKLSLLPALTFGDGMYARPQLRLNYTLSFQDEAARALYLEDDPLHDRELVHFFGIAVEWWFNSSSYQ